jgi:hypothetical protein
VDGDVPDIADDRARGGRGDGRAAKTGERGDAGDDHREEDDPAAASDTSPPEQMTHLRDPLKLRSACP